MGYDGGWGWGGWFVMTVIMILFWALLIAGVIALVHHFTRGQHSHQSGQPPASPPGRGRQRAEDVPAERFARGEIDEDEDKRRVTLLPGVSVIARRRGMWPAIAATAAALVLGMATAALLAATGVFRTSPAAWRTPVTACAASPLPGRVVDVTASDMGPGMMSGPPGPHGMRMMRLTAHPKTVPTGVVSLRITNAGALPHEVMVLSLPTGQPVGDRPTGADGRINEKGSLGEASRSCHAGTGDGIAPGMTGWTTLTLRPGHYELVCNLPGHYAAGMYTELDVTSR